MSQQSSTDSAMPKVAYPRFAAVYTWLMQQSLVQRGCHPRGG
jgi:hypothetical protein